MIALQSDDEPRYSVVVPIHNEEGALPLLVRRLTAVMEELDGPTEVIFVDDGSFDRSYATMQEISSGDPRFKVVRLSRCFGQQAALTAGIDFARGDAIIMMDGDLQHPPELIPQLVSMWRAGNDVVQAVRERRDTDTWFRRVTASAFYTVLSKISEIEVRRDVADFRLIDRKVADVFSTLDERSRYVRGLFSWIGFRHGYVYYTASPRETGTSKYGSREMWALARSGITSFSTRPLRLALHLGFAIGTIALLCGVTAVVARFAGVYTVPGWTSLMLFVAFSSGVQLIVLGVIGVYLSEVSIESKSRPVYVVEDLQAIDSIPSPHMYRHGIVAGPALGVVAMDAVESADEDVRPMNRRRIEAPASR